MIDPTVKEIIDIGGLFGFALVVWLQLKEQTRVLKHLTKEMIRVSERQGFIMERQKQVAEGVQELERTRQISAVTKAQLEAL